MNELIKPNEWKRYFGAAIILLVIFMFMEIIPAVSSVVKHEYKGKVVAEQDVERIAVDFAERQTGLAATVGSTVHQTDKLITGYLSKEKLLDEYTERYDGRFPADTFQVHLTFEKRFGGGFVYVHMYTGDIVGWSFKLRGEQLDGNMQREMAEAELQERLPLLNDFRIADSGSERGTLVIAPEGYMIKESQLEVSIQSLSVNGEPVVTRYKPAFQAPADYVDYVKKQDTLGGWLMGVGYVLMSVALCILAIIYAILYRKHTSFKHGIILTIIFFIAYLIMNLNLMDGIRAAQGENMMSDGIITVTMIITSLLCIPMAGSVYISLVAGDGLWKAQGRNLWPRLGEPGYGDHVWRSMGLSYLFALSMLGLQPLIFKGLEISIGTWSTSDVTMSPYNISILWLMPVLAWAAAISEEAVFRLFGIGLFRRWFRHTFAAAIFPTLFWALGHLSYPFYPSTTRLYELMIIGLLFSFICVRYGFITAVFTHAIFNSVAVGSTLILFGSPIDIVSAVFFILLPVLIAYLLKLWDMRKRMNAPPNEALHPSEQTI